MLPAGLVLTGGGSQLPATVECATEVLGMPVRLGRPTGVSGLSDTVTSPIYATAVGLVQYGAHSHFKDRHLERGHSGGIGKFFARLFSKLRTD
jgi:cell division protein FtsA